MQNLMRDIISYGAKEPGNIARNQKDCPRAERRPLFMEMLTAIVAMKTKVFMKLKKSNNEANKPASRRNNDSENTVWNKFSGREEKKREKSKEGEVADSTFNANQRIARHRELGELLRVTYPGNETPLGLETIFDKSLRRETATRGVKAEKKRFPLAIFFFFRVSRLHSPPVSLSP